MTLQVYLSSLASHGQGLLSGALKKIRQTLATKQNSGKDSEPHPTFLYNLILPFCSGPPACFPIAQTGHKKEAATRRACFLGEHPTRWSFVKWRLPDDEVIFPNWLLFYVLAKAHPTCQEIRNGLCLSMEGCWGSGGNTAEVWRSRNKLECMERLGGREDGSLYKILSYIRVIVFPSICEHEHTQVISQGLSPRSGHYRAIPVETEGVKSTWLVTRSWKMGNEWYAAGQFSKAHAAAHIRKAAINKRVCAPGLISQWGQRKQCSHPGWGNTVSTELPL